MATAKANRNERTDEVTRRNVEQMRELVEQKHQQHEEQRAEAAETNVVAESDPEPDLENVIPDVARNVPAFGGTYGIRNAGGGTSYPTKH